MPKEGISFFKLIVAPLALYFFWAFFYYLKIFVISQKRIQERNYDTMFKYISSMSFFNTIVKITGERMAPVGFIILHFGYCCLTGLCGYACFMNKWVNLAYVTFWLVISVYNGANFYMEYFAKKYETSLAKLEELEKTLTTVQETKKDK